MFLRNYRGEDIPELDRGLAPVFAAGILGIIGLVVAGFWVAYKIGGEA